MRRFRVKLGLKVAGIKPVAGGESNEEIPGTGSSYLDRIVAWVLTPVAAGLSGYVSQWVAVHFPGTPQLDQAQLSWIFVAGLAAGAGGILAWLRGRHKEIERDGHVLAVQAAQRRHPITGTDVEGGE